MVFKKKHQYQDLISISKSPALRSKVSGAFLIWQKKHIFVSIFYSTHKQYFSALKLKNVVEFTHLIIKYKTI